MASVTLTSQRFPAGTTVGAYLKSGFGPSGPGNAAPGGAAAASAVVAANGSLAFTGLADATDYYAYALVGSENRYVAFRTDSLGASASASVSMVTVASAATISPTEGAGVVKVTGTTNITSVTAQIAGRRITLVFAGVLTVVNGSNLKLASNYVSSVDSAFTLVCDGTNWFES